MAVDTPAKIVVIGAGPIAPRGCTLRPVPRLRSRDLRARLRSNNVVQRCGNKAMATPWRMVVTSLGLAALGLRTRSGSRLPATRFLPAASGPRSTWFPCRKPTCWPTTCTSEPKCWPWPAKIFRPASLLMTKTTRTAAKNHPSRCDCAMRPDASEDTADVVIDATGVVLGGPPASGIEGDKAIAKCGQSPDGPVPVADGEPGYYVLAPRAMPDERISSSRPATSRSAICSRSSATVPTWIFTRAWPA